MSRWDDWAAIESAQREADRESQPEPVTPRRGSSKIVRLPTATYTPQLPVERSEPPPRPQIDDATGIRLLIRWWRHMYRVDEEPK